MKKIFFLISAAITVIFLSGCFSSDMGDSGDRNPDGTRKSKSNYLTTWDDESRKGDGSLILDSKEYGRNVSTDIRTGGDLVRHFNRCGLKVVGVGGLVTDPVQAEYGWRLKIGDRFIGIYKYGTSRKQRLRLNNIKKDDCIYILGNMFPIMINGNFVMIDVEGHEKSEEIIQAFKSF